MISKATTPQNTNYNRHDPHGVLTPKLSGKLVAEAVAVGMDIAEVDKRLCPSRM